MSTTESHGLLSVFVCLLIGFQIDTLFISPKKKKKNRHSFSFLFITPIFSPLRNAVPSCKHNARGRVDWQASIYQHTLVVGPF